MKNGTADETIDETHYMEYQAHLQMRIVLPPFILALGTFGNVATIVVMSRIKDNNSSQYAIIMVLAIADLFLLYSGLFTSWMWREFNVWLPGYHAMLCKCYHWILYSSNTTSAWLVVTVTVQRTMAVLWPHRMRVVCTVRRTWMAIIVVVFITHSVHLHIAIAYQLIDNIYCRITSDMYLDFYYFVWHWVDMCISSVGPAICLLVGSTILAWTLCQSASLSSSTVGATSNIKNSHSQDSRKSGAVKVTVMVLALSCTFLILTVPTSVYIVWVHYGYVYSPRTEALSQFFGTLTVFMWYSNSAVNFLLYCITGARFRKEFLKLLCCGMKGRGAGETSALASSGGGSER